MRFCEESEEISGGIKPDLSLIIMMPIATNVTTFFAILRLPIRQIYKKSDRSDDKKAATLCNCANKQSFAANDDER